MNNTIIYVASAFAVGGAIGGIIGYIIAAKKERKIAQEEIDSVKAVFTVPKKEVAKKVPEKKPDGETLANKALNKPSIIEYNKKISDGKYTSYSDADKKEKKSGRYPWEKSDSKTPYVINPNEYGENEEFDQINLTLYADGILADEDDTIINADEVVGDALEHIGDYEDDAVHVCNPKRKAYYEILTDEKSYKEATNKDPHLNDDEED